MGKRGPQPTPKAILKMRGSWRGDINENEPGPNKSIPECPSWLTDDAKTEWMRITPLLFEGDLLTQWDRAALSAYCQAWADYKAACETVLNLKARWQMSWMPAKDKNAGQSMLFNIIDDVKIANNVSEYTMEEHRAVSARDKAMANLLKAIGEFGLSPSSRARITKVDSGKKQPDSKARFFNPQAG